MMPTDSDNGQYVALCGGIGGAKLALGLMHVLAPEQLTIVVNTGDDFEHLGLHISPDIDTVLYTLSGLANPELGWGRRDETWSFMAALEKLGGPSWFRLGDADLAMHADRTARLRAGETLSAITDNAARHLGIRPRIVPMSDHPVRTFVETDEGRLPFQTYFVGRRCVPRLTGIEFEGAAEASPAPAAMAALSAPDLAGIILCPSNPWLSIDPILAIPGWRAALANRTAPAIAVSPIVGGAAVKGPTAKIMGELGLALDVATIASHYGGLIDGLVLDTADAHRSADLGISTHVTGTVMRSLDDRMQLGQASTAFCRRLSVSSRSA
jgi:LPPG:FO 2-phospho-L-lactate transferase